MIRFVDLGRQYEAIRYEINPAIQNILDTTAFVLGAPVADFEKAFAAYCGAKHCIGVANGTDALTITLRSMGVGIGDEVIIPANTFIATALAISHVGATVVPVDVSARTNLITANNIELAITSRTKVVLPVHLFGKPVDIPAIRAVCAKHDIAILEDACQAHGASLHGHRTGSLGDAAAFSFYPGKNLGAYGDGGAIVTNDDDLADKVRLYRDLGQKQKYVHVVKGYNSRLDALQASILSVKLRHLDSWNDQRRSHAELYDQLFAAHGIETNSIEEPGGKGVQHLYCIAVNDRVSLMSILDAAGIGNGIHYPMPIHLHEAYRDLGYPRGSFPVSEKWSDRTLSLPMYPELTDDEIRTVAQAVVSAVTVPA